MTKSYINARDLKIGSLLYFGERDSFYGRVEGISRFVVGTTRVDYLFVLVEGVTHPLAIKRDQPVAIEMQTEPSMHVKGEANDPITIMNTSHTHRWAYHNDDVRMCMQCMLVQHRVRSKDGWRRWVDYTDGNLEDQMQQRLIDDKQQQDQRHTTHDHTWDHIRGMSVYRVCSECAQAEILHSGTWHQIGNGVRTPPWADIVPGSPPTNDTPPTTSATDHAHEWERLEQKAWNVQQCTVCGRIELLANGKWVLVWSGGVNGGVHTASVDEGQRHE